MYEEDDRMKEMRMLGCMVEKLAAERQVTQDELSRWLQCTAQQVKELFRGRLYLTFEQIMSLADHFKCDVDRLLDGDETYYGQKVHCMGEFSNVQNREKILDIIDDYLDLCNATM